MEQIPDNLHINNKHIFDNIKKNLIILKLRKKIYNHVLNNEENDFFDIEKFCRNKFKITDVIIMCNIIV